MKSPFADLLGTGLYPLKRAARLVGVEARSVRRWLSGYSWNYRDGRRSSGPLWSLQYANDDELGAEPVLGFHDLLELRAVAKFVEHGVPLKVIRATIEQATTEFGPSPLHSLRFRMDGRRFFHEAIKLTGRRDLAHYNGEQTVFETVIQPSLYAGIDYAASGQAKRWFPVQGHKVIALGPRKQFGEPIVAEAGVPTDAIAAAVKAEGGDRSRVAGLYRVTPADVSAAVNFERRLRA